LVSGFVRGQGSGSLFLALLSTVYLIGLILNLPIIPVIFDQSSHFIFMQESFYILVISLLFYFSIANRFTIINRTETDFGILAIFVLFGALLSFKYNDLIGLTLAIETATLASYTLAGFMRRNRHSTRAGVQYFILGSLPSVCMLLGFGLLYFITGVATLEDLSLINGINFVDISKPVNVSFERMLLTDSDILTSDLAIFNQDSFY
jgi:NADH:ubiquinone oxidoreductase subunit 2 (subunit N)